MTSRPQLKLGSHLLPGLLAVALFVVLAAVFLGTGFGAGKGFEPGLSITASIGYAMFNLPSGGIGSDGFLAVFETIDVVLVAALVGAVLLARREGSAVEAVRADGGPAEDDTGGER